MSTAEEDAARAATAIALLADRGIRATWEYPGYISVTTPNGAQLAYGCGDRIWYGHVETSEGEYLGDVGDLPEDALPQAIAELIAQAVALQAVDPASQAMLDAHRSDR
jgi:hypothetical protein